MEQKVERTMVKFRHIPTSVLKPKQIEGLTLRKRLMQDFTEIQGTSKRLGTKYQSDRLKEYSTPGDVLESMRPSIEGEKVSECLIEALDKLCESNLCSRTSEPLLNLLAQGPDFNETVVGYVEDHQ